MTRLPTTHASSRPVSYRRQASEYCAAALIGPNQPKNKTSLALPRSGPSRALEPAPQEASARGGASPQPGAVLSNLNPTTPATATPSPGRGDSGYAGGTPPTQLRLNRSDPDVLTPPPYRHRLHGLLLQLAGCYAAECRAGDPGGLQGAKPARPGRSR
jgi:hypothetical protein